MKELIVTLSFQNVRPTARVVTRVVRTNVTLESVMMDMSWILIAAKVSC